MGRILLLTDPPTLPVEVRDNQVVPGGNYREIISLRARLELEKHTVHTCIVRPDCSVLKENKLLQSMIDLNAPRAAPNNNRISSLKLEQYDAIILALTSRLLLAVEECMIQRIVSLGWRGLVLVSSGRIAIEKTSGRFSAHKINSVFLERRGVARVTRAGMNTISSKLYTNSLQADARSVSSNSKRV